MPDRTVSRRIFHRLCGQKLLALSLAGFLHNTATADDRGQEELETWFSNYWRLSEGLSTGRIGQAVWQKEMDVLLSRVSLPSLMGQIDFPRLSEKLRSTDLGKRGEIFHTLMVGGREEVKPGPEPSRVLITKLAYIQKGRSVPPHGHANMVSAFLNLSGEFHIRQYDKLEDRDHSMIVKRSEDSVCGAGTWSSVSDVRNNVHWLTANSEDCFLFTTKMIRLKQGTPFHGRINIDVRDAKELGSGRVEAPKISHTRAAALY